jgi:hypothetical protein
MTESFARNDGNRFSMTIQTKNLILAPHLPRHLRALLHGPEEFENVAGLRVADGIHDQLLSASSDFKTSVENARETDPWRFGFGVIHKVDNVLIGLCGFPVRPILTASPKLLTASRRPIKEGVTRPKLRTRSSISPPGTNRFDFFAPTRLPKRTLPLASWKNAALKKSVKQSIRKIICRSGGGKDQLNDEAPKVAVSSFGFRHSPHILKRSPR